MNKQGHTQTHTEPYIHRHTQRSTQTQTHEHSHRDRRGQIKTYTQTNMYIQKNCNDYTDQKNKNVAQQVAHISWL